MSVLTEITRRFQGDKQATPVADAPDALELIRRDHEACNALFETALSDSTPSAAKKAAIAKVCAALLLHARMEEAIFYPALRKAGKQNEKDSVLEAAEEHGMAKDMIAKIQRIAGRDETLEAKVTVLKELVQHHVEEEESTIFDEARKVLGTKLQALGEEMQRFKDRAAAGSGKRTVRKKTRTTSASAAGRKKSGSATGRKKSAARR